MTFNFIEFRHWEGELGNQHHIRRKRKRVTSIVRTEKTEGDCKYRSILEKVTLKQTPKGGQPVDHWVGGHKVGLQGLR